METILGKHEIVSGDISTVCLRIFTRPKLAALAKCQWISYVVIMR